MSPRLDGDGHEIAGAAPGGVAEAGAGAAVNQPTGDDLRGLLGRRPSPAQAPQGPTGPPPPADAFRPGHPVRFPRERVPETTPIAPKRRRWWRRRRTFVIGAVVLLMVSVAGDRFAVLAAESQMAPQIEASLTESLACDAIPATVSDVSIGGFPFLTQIAFGTFKHIGVTIQGISTPGPRISSVEAHLKGLHLPVQKIIAGRVGEIPVDDVEATVRLDYDDVNTFLADQPGKIQINPVDGGREVEVSGRADIPLLGAQEIGGVTTFEVRDNEVTLIPSEVSLRGALDLDVPVPGGVGRLLPSIPIPVGDLPFDLTVVEATTDASGLSLTATAKDVNLPEADPATRQCPPSDSTET
ncbi:LmeA family phospholipid-binding protein [Parafrankia elaeagni]|uniref:LmeA family phospholipid-binding protein n=1 Tax=Parafrankia elaeagni TaxID=222534 RepID=UPI00036206BE|nr:DUF2993 domain-containing protein [Parafrankia elaeagni]